MSNRKGPFRPCLNVFSIVVIFLFAYPPPGHCDEPVRTLEYGELKPGATAYTFKNDLPLRENQSQTSPVVQQLKPGTAVTVVKKLAEKKSENGFEDFYYEVKTRSSPEKTGIIWGGDLSKCDFQQGKARLLLSLHGTGSDSHQKMLRAMLIENSKIISESSFKPIELPESHSYSYSIYATRFDTTGFNGKPPVTKFSFEYGACDYPYGDILVSTAGAKVRFLLEETAAGNEEGGTGFDYIMPNQKGGQANKLIVVRTTETNSPKSKKVTRAIYRWDGEKLVKQ